MDDVERRRPDPGRRPDGRSRRAWRRWVVGSALLGLVGAASLALADSQADARHSLEERFAARGELSAEFVGSFADQLLDRELEVAADTLDGTTPQGPFDSLVAAFGFQAALLLDARGRVLAVSPARPSLIGEEVASQYPHLRAAVAGERAISPVVVSAAVGEPVVGFAVPYDTPTGRRVISGAFHVSDTPLQSYLAAFSSLRGYRALIVDRDGAVVTASSDELASGRLAEQLPELAGRVQDDTTGTVTVGDGEDTFYAVHDVAGTPWRLVTVVPVATLLDPVSGASAVLPWTILGASALALALVFWLGLRLIESRRRLQRLNARLDELASVDGLTGVANRRRSGEVLAAAQEQCERAELPLSVLLIDVDHFKRVNDTFGHASGDEVLCAVVDRIAGALRDGDHLGRWGGEEFLVVLPGADLAEARAVAERLREAVAERPVAVGSGGDEIDVTTSTGVASGVRNSPEVLVHTADRALYAAKAAGRNVVIASSR